MLQTAKSKINPAFEKARQTSPSDKHDVIAFPTGKMLKAEEILARKPFELAADKHGFKGQTREQFIVQSLMQQAALKTSEDNKKSSAPTSLGKSYEIVQMQQQQQQGAQITMTEIDRAALRTHQITAQKAAMKLGVN